MYSVNGRQRRWTCLRRIPSHRDFVKSLPVVPGCVREISSIRPSTRISETSRLLRLLCQGISAVLWASECFLTIRAERASTGSIGLGYRCDDLVPPEAEQTAMAREILRDSGVELLSFGALSGRGVASAGSALDQMVAKVPRDRPAALAGEKSNGPSEDGPWLGDHPLCGGIRVDDGG